MAGGRKRSDPVVAEWPPTGHWRVLPGQGRLGPRRCPLPRFGNLLSGDRGRYVRQVLDSERGADSARSQGPGDHKVAVSHGQRHPERTELGPVGRLPLTAQGLQQGGSGEQRAVHPASLAVLLAAEEPGEGTVNLVQLPRGWKDRWAARSG